MAGEMPTRLAIGRNPRNAVTLIELLVVIAIIGVLIALLLPAVQQARGAARRMNCKNNLHQVGLALHNYHNSHRCFPPSQVVTPCRPLGSTGVDYPAGWWFWYVRILPYLEQGALYDQIDLSDDALLMISYYKDQTSVNIPVFLCPSDPNSNRIFTLDTWWQGPMAFAHQNYLGVRSSTCIEQPNVDVCEMFRAKDPVRNNSGDGMFPGVNVSKRIGDVVDGTSHTIHVGERPVDEALEFGWWAMGSGVDLNATADAVLDCSEGLRRGNSSTPGDMLHFWSMHPGGAHFLCCDASVHFLSYSMDHNTFLALGSRNGGEAISGF
jgi:prepilin-type N-terminal cleavage/methylation domain-containing protein